MGEDSGSGVGTQLREFAAALGVLYEAACVGRWEGVTKFLATYLGVRSVEIVDRGSRGRPSAPIRLIDDQGLHSSRGRRRASTMVAGLVTEPAVGEERREALAALEEQLGRLLALAERRDEERRRRREAQATLDRLDLAVLLYDSRGRLVFVNEGARVAANAEPTIELDGEGLRLADPERQQALNRAVARMIAASTDPGARLADHLEVPRAGRRPLRLLVVPLHAEAEPGAGACAVFLSDSEAGIEAPAHILQRHYGLTQAEARVVAKLLQGGSLDLVAEQLGVQRETVRSHIKRIYAKVGTTRQSDLVAILLRGPAGLRWEC